MQPGFTYAAALSASQRINWQIDDIIGGDRKLDFSKPFMPESLARTEPLDFLDKDEKLVLNQIRGNGYLCIFGLVEEFILPFVLDHARPMLDQDDGRTRALLQFATGFLEAFLDFFARVTGINLHGSFSTWTVVVLVAATSEESRRHYQKRNIFHALSVSTPRGKGYQGRL